MNNKWFNIKKYNIPHRDGHYDLIFEKYVNGITTYEYGEFYIQDGTYNRDMHDCIAWRIHKN